MSGGGYRYFLIYGPFLLTLSIKPSICPSATCGVFIPVLIKLGPAMICLSCRVQDYLPGKASGFNLRRKDNSSVSAFLEYSGPVALADDPPSQGLLGHLSGCRAKGIHSQIVGHLLQRRMERILGTGMRPDSINLAFLSLLVIEGTGLFENPCSQGFIKSAHTLELLLGSQVIRDPLEILFLQVEAGSRGVAAFSALLAPEFLPEELDPLV